MDISTRLDDAMRKAGIASQSALARASGVPQPTINRILKRVGTKGPETETLKKLASACNVSFSWLTEGREGSIFGKVEWPFSIPLADLQRLDLIDSLDKYIRFQAAEAEAAQQTVKKSA